jgi:N-acetylmuramoyl-L-alanine amidase
LLAIVVTLGVNVGGAQAQTLKAKCSRGDRVYVVVRGDTLGGIAHRFGKNWSTLAAHNHIANPNRIHPRQIICIASGRAVNNHESRYTALVSVFAASASKASVAVGYGNAFPYPACTWWANQRYYQLHGVFVPWRDGSMAWQWAGQAHRFGWQVSARPSVGSIVDMQPWVQGAYGAGHVAIVERVLGNGTAIASSMSWGYNPYAVVYIQVRPGSGITFLRQ